MKKRIFSLKIFRYLILVLLCGSMLFLSGCTQEQGYTISQSATPELIHASLTPAPTLVNEPAVLYGNVITNKRVVSIILEGYIDDNTVQTVASEMKRENATAIFFISGIVADEHAETVKQIASQGFTVGNYGLNGEKDMQDNDVLTNIHQFQRGQELISKAIGKLPTLFRCNGTEYTQEVMQAASYTGLEAGVQPNVFLNHASFGTYEDALAWVQKLVRGSIITIKLGQALDADEYQGIEDIMDNRAIDPPPMLSDRMEDTIANTYANVTNVVGWLLQALDEMDYTIVTPQRLQREHITMFDNPAELDADTLAMLDADNYTLPVTDSALMNIPKQPQVTADPEATADETAVVDGKLAQNVVFIGDSITMGLQDYVEWRRLTQPEYLGDTQFLTTNNFSIGLSLLPVNSNVEHPTINGESVTVAQGLKQLGAKNAIIMPGQTDISGYSPEQFIDNLKLLVYEIRQANPDITIWLESVPPGIEDRYTKPNNGKIFSYNLAMYKFCLQYDIPFLDVAYPLRNAKGDLTENFCLDTETYGFHISDEGCEKWIDFIRNYVTN